MRKFNCVEEKVEFPQTISTVYQKYNISVMNHLDWIPDKGPWLKHCIFNKLSAESVREIMENTLFSYCR